MRDVVGSLRRLGEPSTRSLSLEAQAAILGIVAQDDPAKSVEILREALKALTPAVFVRYKYRLGPGAYADLSYGSQRLGINGGYFMIACD